MRWFSLISIFAISCLLCVGEGVSYGENCTSSSDCTADMYMECDTTCVCTAGHVENNAANGCLTELGHNCHDAVPCYDEAATCDINYICTCNTATHYDSNGLGTHGGSCLSKHSVGEECPDPNTVGADTCAIANSACTSDATASTNYICQCSSSYIVDDSGNCVAYWLDWSAWGDCSVTCGDGTQTRTRTCSVTGSCSGADTEDRNCNIVACRRLDLNGACTIGGSSTNYLQCKDRNAGCINTNTIYWCSCNQGYHNESDACIANKALGKDCEGVAEECSDPNAQCLGRKCTCSDAFYDDNGFVASGDCRAISELQVTGITFSEVQTTQFVVTWTPPSGKESYISGYRVGWYHTDNSIAGSSYELGSGLRTYTITDITPGKAYRVSIISMNDETEHSTPRSTSSSKEQAAKPGMPGPINKQTSDLDIDGGIKLNWTAPSGSVSGYIITLSSGTVNNESTSTSASVLFTPSWLLNGHRYTVTIQAKSQTFTSGSPVLGEIYTEEIKTVVKVPSKPRSFTCYNIKDESIVFTWQSPTSPNGDLVSYIIEVYNIDKQLQFTNDTSDVVLKYEVDQLSPGTTYIFQVYTRNEMYTSTVYGSTTCMTKAKLSDPPNDLNTTNITSRNFEISWDRPTKIYSEEIYGYVLQIKRDDVCVKEVVYNCSDCIGTIMISNLTNMCNDTVQEVVEKSKVELGSVQTHTVLAGSLRPDTIYAISVSAVNNKGKGNVADFTQKTKEEAPNKPTVVSVGNITTTSFKVTWSIEGDRPGPTNYTVMLSADSPAESKEFTVIGFEMRTFVATALEESWDYTVAVKAATSIGEVTSDVTGEYRTLPTASGMVSGVTIVTAPDGNYRQIDISWNAPDILERNSIIVEYAFRYNATVTIEETTILQASSDDSYTYTRTVDVTPEIHYKFEVYAVSNHGVDGQITQRVIYAPPGVPPNNVEDTDDAYVIPRITDIEQRSFTLTLIKEFFEQDDFGMIQTTGLIGCEYDKCEFDDVWSLDEFNSMRTWQISSKEGFPPYRITPDDWLNYLLSQRINRRSVTYTELQYTVGQGNCDNVRDDTFCNGPLQPRTKYMIVAVVCTHGGCLQSNPYGPFTTLVEERCEISESSSNNITIYIITGVVLGGIILLLAVYAGYVTVVNRRLKAKQGDQENKNNRACPVYVNESFLTGAAEMQDGPNLETFNNPTPTAPETLYSQLDENLRDDRSTYDVVQPL